MIKPWALRRWRLKALTRGLKSTSFLSHVIIGHFLDFFFFFQGFVVFEMPLFNYHERQITLKKNLKKGKKHSTKKNKKSLPRMCSCIKFTLFFSIFDSMKMCHTVVFFPLSMAEAFIFKFWLFFFSLMQVLFSSGETQDVFLFFLCSFLCF